MCVFSPTSGWIIQQQRTCWFTKQRDVNYRRERRSGVIEPTYLSGTAASVETHMGKFNYKQQREIIQ